MEIYHTKENEKVLRELETSETKGLSSEQVKERLSRYGKNELQERKGRAPWKMLLDQFTETMVVILIIAAIVSGFLGKEIETIAIAAIVILFAVLGFIQEYRAEKAMEALRQMAVPFVRVIRNGVMKEVSAKELVPGDVVIIETGNIISADLRILEESNLKVMESALTGEAEPVQKSTATIEKENVPIGDRSNMLFMGTMVAMGRGKGVVVATGMETELGKIAGMIQEVTSQKTLLQKRLDQLGKWLAAFGGLAAALVMVMGVFLGEEWADMFLVGISVAVAVVPEGLPAVVTITLALGSQKMLRLNALVRKLPAVESLGSVTVICSDKTGTLTENKMTLTAVETAGAKISFPPEGDYPKGTKLCLLIGTLCNDAELQEEEEEEKVFGEPTEAAIVAGGNKAGLKKYVLESNFKRINEVPFDSARKRMSTVHYLQDTSSISEDIIEHLPKPYNVLTKGAVDNLLRISDQLWTPEGVVPIDDEWRKKILNAHDEMAASGIRVLGLAYKEGSEASAKADPEEIEKSLIFAGMVGMIDPPRPAVKPAVAKCKTAGIRPIMITGDYPLTAKAIAQDLGIMSTEKQVTGEMLEGMSDEELKQVVGDVNVFARVSPRDKLRIVTALQEKGEVVAMTGDGVNDSPALKKADIGVAMGITGTDVAKEASDMVLLDDNFATIVASVQEGRTIFDNLVRFVKFSLGGNFGKVLVMLFAPLLGIIVALNPLQLLWLNLLTDGLMGLGLGVEPSEKNVMNRSPRAISDPILDRKAIVHVIWTGILIAIISLGIGYFYNTETYSDNYWQTMLFCTIGFTQIGHALGLRASSKSVFSLTSNKLFTGMFFLTLVLHLGVIYLPFANKFFSLVTLDGIDLLISAALGSLLSIGVQIERKRIYNE